MNYHTQEESFNSLMLDGNTEPKQQYCYQSKGRSESIERMIDQVNATFGMEGMPLSENDREILRQFARGEITMEQIIEKALTEDKK
jgi:hypothetical protein